MDALFFFSAAFIAGVAGATTGFGTSTILMAVALFFVDFKTALPIVAFFHLVSNIGRITLFRHGFDARLFFLLGIPSVLFAFTGASLTAQVPQDLLKFVLGIFLVLFAVVSFVRPNLELPQKALTITIAGGISGFLAGLLGAGGGIRGALLISFNLEKARYLATSAAIALAVDITRIPIYLSSGFLKPDYYVWLLVLPVIALAAVYASKKIVGVMPEKLFKKIVLIAIALFGLKFIVDGIYSFVR